jgi:two-component system sporulation sensor kinase A
LEKLGQPFYSTKETGTGLGFMVSKKIIESHNGTIHITSKVNIGTKIEMAFPH